ncbi:hypothetical protein KKH27_12010 [bacterium]|nr:hypothetical protein [bacterium]
MNDTIGTMHESLGPLATNIELLAADRELVTPELHLANDFYGHASNLKRHVGLDPEYVLKAMVEHGPHLTDYMWDCEEKSPLPFYLCAAEYYARIFSARTGKTAVPIGPQFAYLPARPELMQPPAARTLVVFPYHSTHHILNRVDEDDFFRRVADYQRHFDRTIICVYWRNVLLGDHRVYMRRGYECVTAGHIYDREFVLRLRSIIASASTVVSANAGTEVLYSVLMNRPVWIIYDPPHSSARTDEFHTQAREVMTCDRSLLREVVRAFSEPSDVLTADQRELIRTVSGQDYIRSPETLRDILAEAEREYARLKLRLRRHRAAVSTTSI